jgi:hypothetical protein
VSLGEAESARVARFLFHIPYNSICNLKYVLTPPICTWSREWGTWERGRLGVGLSSNLRKINAPGFFSLGLSDQSTFTRELSQTRFLNGS